MNKLKCSATSPAFTAQFTLFPLPLDTLSFAPVMDLLDSQLAALQRQLSWVAVEPIDWKLYVQTSSWLVCLFESYLL